MVTVVGLVEDVGEGEDGVVGGEEEDNGDLTTRMEKTRE